MTPAEVRRLTHGDTQAPQLSGTLDSARDGLPGITEDSPSLEKNGIVFSYLWDCIHVCYSALFQKEFQLDKAREKKKCK